MTIIFFSDIGLYLSVNLQQLDALFLVCFSPIPLTTLVPNKGDHGFRYGMYNSNYFGLLPNIRAIREDTGVLEWLHA